MDKGRLWNCYGAFGGENVFMIAIIAGFLAGVVSGMGIGGGMILIPALVFFLVVPQQAAQAINLWYFLPTAIIALCVHIKQKRVEIKKAAWLILSGIPSAMAGAYFAMGIDGRLMGKFFGAFLAVFGLKEIKEAFTNKK